MAYLEVYQDASKARRSWRWRRVAGNFQIVASSGEGYTRRWSAKRAAKQAYPNEQIRVIS